MSDFDTGRLIYLIILGTVLAGYFFASHRQNLGTTARHAMLWGLIFVGAIAGVGLWMDVKDDLLPRQAVFADQGRIEIPQSVDGHYYVVAELNGAPIEFVVDTGATDIVLSQEDATRAGINPASLRYSGRANTANGVVDIAMTRVGDFRIGDIADRDVPVSVNGGAMEGSLLGMTYLNLYDRIEISGNRLILER